MVTLYPSKMSYYPSPVPAPAPSIPVDPTEDPNFEPKKQCCAFTWAIFLLIGSCLMIFFELIIFLKFRLTASILYLIGYVFCTVFFLLILASPKYVGGNPKFHKLWPFIIGQLFIVVSSFLMSSEIIIVTLFVAVVSTLIMYFSYIRDDTDSPGCCKPWIYIRKMGAYGYPPYPHPSQGYPSYPYPYHDQQQQSGYPTYPPQPQAYPPSPPAYAPSQMHHIIN